MQRSNKKVKNAADILVDILAVYLSSGNGVTVAHKFISDTLKYTVDLDLCSKVVTSAEVARTAISSLLETVGDYHEKQ